MPRARQYKEIQHIQIDEIQLPVEIHHEWRQSARVSIGRDKAIIRLPIMISASTKTEHLQWAKDWIVKKLKKDHTLKVQFSPKGYQSGSQLEVRGTLFTLIIDELIDLKSASGQRVDRNIYIKLPLNLPAELKNRTCQKLLHKVMSQTYNLHVQRRVHELNDKYFNKKINSIRLKNNSSNWGSCSSNCNISISSRLLLAPPTVLDYIIIHELAHLVHHNHSKAYWSLVEKVMPNYMEAEIWLKKEGPKCSW
ncbi:MAG: DUF45 domain-containing protein [Saprospiraceae bacterium]|nr:DUF45 domain-containing protein [Saprospiraceae bacterium]